MSVHDVSLKWAIHLTSGVCYISNEMVPCADSTSHRSSWRVEFCIAFCHSTQSVQEIFRSQKRYTGSGGKFWGGVMTIKGTREV